MPDRIDKEWQGKLTKFLSEMKCPTTVQQALQGLEKLGIDVVEAEQILAQKRDEWMKNEEFKEKLSELGLGEAGIVCCGHS